MKKLISVIVALVLLMPSVFAAFEDMEGTGSEMQSAVDTMVEKRYINGTSETEFSPFKLISRAELAAVMLRILNKMDNTLECTFTDVTKYDWYYYVAASSEKEGIINGFDDGTFRGDDSITKEQLVAVLVRVLQDLNGTAAVSYTHLASNGTAFGLQYAHSAGTLAVFTAASMSNDANGDGDCGAYTVGDVVASVAVNTVYHIEISVIGEKLVVGVSSGDEEPTYTTIDIDDYSKFAKIEYVRIGNYRYGSGLSISNLVTSTNVTVDPDMIDIEGAEKIAKVLGQSVTETYTAAPIVPADGEVFTWDINNDDITLTPSEDTKSVEVTVGENVEPGTYTLSVASSASAEKATTYSIEVGGYTYIIADATGDSTTIDTSVLAAHDASTQYMITTATADGTLVSQSTVEAVSAPLVVDTTGADKVEVAPVYVFSEVGNVASGYDFGGAFADAAYNFEFTKQTTERSDILVNGILVGNNVCQDGTGRAMTDEDRTYAINDIKVEGGSIVISAVDCVAGHDATAFSMTDITAVKAPSIVNRVPKVWVTGDSLVAKYYGTESEYLGTSRSGWGQMLENFITDDYEVINLGNSGATTQSLYDTVYPTFLSQAQEGDMVVFESGYNDQGQTRPEAMQALVVEMAEGIKATGADLVYVTPNASRHDLKESVKYAGSLIAGAVASDTPYIDLSYLSHRFFYENYDGEVVVENDSVVVGVNYNEDGTLNGNVIMQNVGAGESFDWYMADNKFVWNSVDGETGMTPASYEIIMDSETIGLSYGLDTGAPNDRGLHSSYLGAMKFAEIVAQGLADLGFDGIDKTFTWSTEDTLGNTITVQVQ